MFSAKEIGKKAGLVIVSILLSLFVAEVILRYTYPEQTKDRKSVV